MGSRLLCASAPTLGSIPREPRLAEWGAKSQNLRIPLPGDLHLWGRGGGGGRRRPLHLAAAGFGGLVLKGQACRNSCEGRPCGPTGLGRRGLGPLGREGVAGADQEGKEAGEPEAVETGSYK